MMNTTTFTILLFLFHFGLSLSQSLPPSYHNISFLTLEFARAKIAITHLMESGGVRGPILVRLAWHDAGTYCQYCSEKGGPHGLIRYPGQSSDPADNGLNTAWDPLQTIINEEGFNSSITIADFWQFAADVAIEWMGGPHLTFRPGRVDSNPDHITPFDRLPDGGFAFPDFEPTTKYIRDIFYRMGFNDREITALIGAHTLGECHQDWSGFSGQWTPDPNSFDNGLYEEMLDYTWSVTPNARQYQDDNEDGLMMLHTDLTLIHDPVFLPIVKEYAMNQTLFFNDFSLAFQKLQEAGVDTLLPPIEW